MTQPTYNPDRWRSLLFVPGARADRFEKADKAGADLVCIDLEDAVAPAGKDAAREATFSFLASYKDRQSLVGLRVNAVGSPEGRDDLKALVASRGVDFVMVPKVSGPDDIAIVRAAFGADRIIPVLESARAIQNVDAIADHPGVAAAVYGAIDLSADIGCELAWEPHLYGRSRCQMAFAASRKTLFDVPYIDVSDDEGLVRETRAAMSLGIRARAAIHPRQVSIIHDTLAPSPEEVANAERIIDAFEQAEGGVALLDGKLLELPVVKSAQRVLALSGR